MCVGYVYTYISINVHEYIYKHICIKYIYIYLYSIFVVYLPERIQNLLILAPEQVAFEIRI